MLQKYLSESDELDVTTDSSTLYYFAYGMLTLHDTMNNLGAMYVDACTLQGWKLVLYQHANIEQDSGSRVSGALWKIDRQILQYLDKIEGYPTYYDRIRVKVHCAGKVVPAICYVMTSEAARSSAGLGPTREYLYRIARGYKDCGIPLQQLNTAIKEFNSQF